MTQKPKTDDALLDEFFAAERAAPPAPDADFMATVLAQSQAALPLPEQKPRGLWSNLKVGFSQLGGWPVGASLASALAIGFFFGVSPPESVLEITTAYFDADSLSDLAGLPQDATLVWNGS